ncbi:MAG: hypothetical protein EU529_15960 [Promethearchaeota archaeon]|nr:MAG: hypothetical protein EU529_15960 [Candidatus Lokiarchaeota archaeon]
MAKKKAPAEKEPAPAKKETAKKEEVVAEEVEPETPSKITYKKIKCNLWRTRLHGEELGIYQSMKYQAKTRWFSKTFDIEGLIEIDDEKKYIIAYNKNDFHDEKKRLVLRLFTILEEKMGVGKGGSFKGGIELSYTHSLVQSVEVKYAAPVFFTHIPSTPMMARVVRGHRLFRTRWSFPLLPEEKGDNLQLVIMKGSIGFGNDYSVYLGDVKVANVDHQKVTKDVEIDIYNEDLAKDKTFVMLITLFGCICFFMKDIEKEIKKYSKQLKKTGTTSYAIPKFELDLFKNPRMIRR